MSQASGSELHPTCARPGGLRVLVLEMEHGTGFDLVWPLYSWGHEVTVAGTAAATWLARYAQFDVLITDLPSAHPAIQELVRERRARRRGPAGATSDSDPRPDDVQPALVLLSIREAFTALEAAART